jgi:hypothetical protein
MLILAVDPICPARWIAPIFWVVFSLSFGSSIASADIDRDDTLSVPPFFASPSLDTTPVEVQMRGIRWRVPRNFLVSAQFSDRSEDRARRVKSASLRIVTTLSTLKEATPETLACYKALRADVCLDTIIMLTYWLDVSPSVWNRAAIVEAALDPRDDLFGLTKVNAKLSLLEQDTYVFYDGSFENSTVIQCKKWTGELLQDCTVRLEVDGVPLTYSFAKSQLPNWRRIQAGVVATIKSFETGDAK